MVAMGFLSPPSESLGLCGRTDAPKLRQSFAEKCEPFDRGASLLRQTPDVISKRGVVGGNILCFDDCRRRLRKGVSNHAQDLRCGSPSEVVVPSPKSGSARALEKQREARHRERGLARVSIFSGECCLRCPPGLTLPRALADLTFDKHFDQAGNE